MFTKASEKKLLKLSVFGALFFAILGIVWGTLISSYLIIFDGLYSFVSVMLSLLSLLVAQYISKSDSRRFPFGKEMLEPVVIIVKYAAILILCLLSVLAAIDAMLSGGREINVGHALIFAVVNTVGCAGVYFLLKKNKAKSGFIQAEANQWRMDTLLSTAVLVGFFFAVLLSFTPYQSVIPYVDPLMVLLVAGYFLKVPITEMSKAFREVLEMSPDQPIQTRFKEVTTSIEARYNIQESIVRIAKVGNKLFIEIDFILDEHSKSVTISEQDEIREEIFQHTKDVGYKKWLTVSFTNEKKWAEKRLV